jgi:hypothetical protein
MQDFFISPRTEMKGEKERFKKNVMAFFLAKARFVTMGDGSLFSVGTIW